MFLMKWLIVRLIIGILLLNNSAAKEKNDEKEEELLTNVIELTDEAFKILLESNDRWLVNFYTPWSEIYRNFLPEWIDLADDYFGKIKLASLNVIKYMTTGDMNKLRTYPTIKYFPATRKDVYLAKVYRGEFNREELVEWVDGVINCFLSEIRCQKASISTTIRSTSTSRSNTSSTTSRIIPIVNNTTSLKNANDSDVEMGNSTTEFYIASTPLPNCTTIKTDDPEDQTDPPLVIPIFKDILGFFSKFLSRHSLYETKS
ncbi:hypothetical protein CHUAL_010962 [Chamberlinius hualienensis]